MRRWILLSLAALCCWSIAPQRSANAQTEGFRGPGRYRIENVASGKALDLRREDGRTVQQWSSSSANNQQWDIEDAGGGYYFIRSVETGRVLDFAENRARDGVGVIVADRRDSDSQKWRISETGNAQYTIVARAGKALDVPANTRTQDGARLQVMGLHGLENQRFRFYRLGDLQVANAPRPRDRNIEWRPTPTPTPAPIDRNALFNGPGRYTIQIVASGKALDLDGRDGESLIQHPPHGRRNQQWDVEDAGGGYFYIRSAENSKVLEVADRRVRDGSAVLGRSFNRTDQQKWRIATKGNGEFTIVSRLGKALELPNSSSEDNVKLYVWSESGRPNQRFRFTRIAQQAETYTGGRVRNERGAITAPAPEAPYTPGSMRWRGRVDIEVLLNVRGDQVAERHVAGNSFNNGKYTFTTPLPARELNLRIRNIKVRGSVEIVEQPTLSNGWMAVIRIRDAQGNAADYEFELIW